MNNYSAEIWTIITRVLSGEATPAEQDELRKWLDEDPKHKEFYRNIRASWTQDPEQSSETFFFDYESGLSKLRSKLDQESSVSRKKIQPERHPSLKYGWAIAAVVLLAVLLSVFASLYIWEQPASMKSYATSNVEQRIITLDDGSVVRLNRDSNIEVWGNDRAPLREVRLKGEAFFDVAKDPDRPFIIHTDEAVVQVLGTSFNVKEGDEVMVAVQEGIVSLRNRNYEEKSAAKLTAGQLGLLSNDGQDVKIEETNVENYMSWMNGYLRFESMPFDQVIRQLERIYGVEHKLDDPSISSVQLSVYTEQMEREEVLETIALALDLTYYEHEGVIQWQKGRRTSEKPSNNQ